LVGGHCIGIDPYYLTHKAQAYGYHPELILAGRRLNDGMGSYVASQLVKAVSKRGGAIGNSRVLVMGLTFKENCPDIRDTRVIDIVSELTEYGCQVDVHDPWVDSEEAEREFGIKLTGEPSPGSYDAIVLAVGHAQFARMNIEQVRALGKPQSIIYDLKYVFSQNETDLRL
jgi:UDP-N-acetyl-D-galactosamine dehydrogenase